MTELACRDTSTLCALPDPALFDSSQVVATILADIQWATTLGFWDETRFWITPLGAKFVQKARLNLSIAHDQERDDATLSALAQAARLWSLVSLVGPTVVSPDVDLTEVWRLADTARRAKTQRAEPPAVE